MNVKVFVSAPNLPKITQYGNCHSTAPIKATKVLNVPFLGKGEAVNAILNT